MVNTLVCWNCGGVATLEPASDIALREELERAKKDLADSRLNHIDANQRNIQAIVRAEAAEVELAKARKEQSDEWDEIHALLTKFGIPSEEDGSFLSLETRIERLAKRKLPSAEGE